VKRLLTLPVLLPAALALMLGAALRAPRPTDGMDLAAFGALPVLHNGRIKPLDSIARNSLLSMRGKQTLRSEGRSMSAVAWLLEMSSDLKRGDARRIFVINDPDVLGLLGKRQTKDKYYSYGDLEAGHDEIHGQARQAAQIPVKRRSRFQAAVVDLDGRLTRYQRLKYSLRVSDTDNSLTVLGEYESAVPAGLAAFHKHQTSNAKGFDNEALNRLGFYFRRFRFLAEAAYFKPVPPPAGRTVDDWQNMGEGLMQAMRDGVIPPAIRLYADILDAYSKRDAARFNAGTAKLGRALVARFPAAAQKARCEERFNRFQPFYQGMILYVVVFLLICASWLYRPEALRTAAYRTLWLAFAVHTAGLIARMWLQGRPPVTNLYSSAIFVGWGAVLLGAVLERFHRGGLMSLVSAAVGFCTLILAHHLALGGDTLEMMQAVLDSNFWLGTHVVTITVGYSSTFLAAMIAHVYIFRALAGRLDKGMSESLTQMTYGVVCFSLFFSFVGTILGGIWADQSWGRFWGWDPKENGALLLVLWHGLILHARLGGYIRERGLAAMAVFGGIVCALAWFGVNMLGIGLHTYGFMDKAFYWLMAFIAGQLVVIGLAFVPPRFYLRARSKKSASLGR